MATPQTQMVLDMTVTKAFSQPRSSTPLHKFRVGGDGTSMLDITVPLEKDGFYTLRNNFNMLVVRASGRLRLTGVAHTYTERNGVKEYDEVSLVVNGFAVLTQEFQSVRLQNLSDEAITLTLAGCASEMPNSALQSGTKDATVEHSKRLAASLSVRELQELVTDSVKSALSNP